nr:hypothetical protein [Legionella jordanis]
MATETRSVHKNIPLPSVEALTQCKEVATTVEAAFYFRDQFESKLVQAGKMDEGKKALSHINEFAETVSMQRELKSDPWTGNVGPLTDFHNLQRNLAEKAADSLSSKIDGNIIMDYAINDNAQFIRGYAADGKALDSESVQDMDKLFNAWLAENNKISKNSVIYEADNKGHILRDSSGQPVVANGPEVRGMVSNDQNGFTNFLQQFNKEGHEIAVTTRQQPFPEKKPEVTQAPTPTAAKEAPATAPATPEATASNYAGPAG